MTIGTINAAAISDCGLVRESNEDRCFYRAFTYTGELGPEQGLIAAVADGMGGQAAGEAASELAIQVFASKFTGMASGTMSRKKCPDWTDLIREAFQDANAAVCEEAFQWRGRAGMGTTLTAVIIADDVMYIGHAGDSRAYIIRNGQLMRLTQDHTWVAMRVKDGLMTHEEAEVSERRGQLVNAIGIKENVQPDVDVIALRPGDRILLCTDGLTEMVDDDEIAVICSRGNDTYRQASRLITTANHAGGHDNMAIVLIECSSKASIPQPRLSFPRLAAPKWAIIAFVAILVLIIADIAFIALRGSSNNTTEDIPKPAASVDGPSQPVDDGPRILDLQGRPVGVDKK